MNLSWLKNNNGNSPKFWEDYIASFSTSKSPLRFVVFDCKTTGNDVERDKIISMAAVSIIENQIKISETFSIFVKQDDFNIEMVKTYGVLNNDIDEKYVEIEAVIQFLGFVKNAILVGHKPNFSIEMINKALNRLNLGDLKNEYMDINIMYQKLKNLSSKRDTSIDELCEIYKIKTTDRFTASGDTFILAQIFIILSKKLNINK